MKIAIMQPYVFPYIGYFQLIHAVDKFIFYDDVHFIKKGWINRNNILINGQASVFTIPLKEVSQNKLINESQLAISDKWIKQFDTTLRFNYKNAPYFNETMKLIEATIETAKTDVSIAALAEFSVKQVAAYLDLKTTFETSSKKYAETKGMEKAERLKKICQLNNSTEYINAAGGMEIYSKEDFFRSGITLQFIQPEPVHYSQFDKMFVPWLSIIDVLMFNEKTTIKKMLDQYKLI